MAHGFLLIAHSSQLTAAELHDCDSRQDLVLHFPSCPPTLRSSTNSIPPSARRLPPPRGRSSSSPGRGRARPGCSPIGSPPPSATRASRRIWFLRSPSPTRTP